SRFGVCRYSRTAHCHESTTEVPNRRASYAHRRELPHANVGKPRRPLLHVAALPVFQFERVPDVVRDDLAIGILRASFFQCARPRAELLHERSDVLFATLANDALHPFHVEIASAWP